MIPHGIQAFKRLLTADQDSTSTPNGIRIMPPSTSPGSGSNFPKNPNADKTRDIARTLCPKCGAVMITRINKSTNQEFLGCSKFPKCKGSRNLSGAPVRPQATHTYEIPHGWEDLDEVAQDWGFGSWQDFDDRHEPR